MKKNNAMNNTVNNANNYSYTAVKSGNQTIVVWDNLAEMMMGNSMPPMGVRIIKDKGDKRK